VWSDRASDAVGISAPAMFGRALLIAALGRDRKGDGAGRTIATGRTEFTQRRLNGKRAILDGATASLVIGGREPAKERPAILLRADLDHDVSILITATARDGSAARHRAGTSR
jgi:hypothetical protein